MNDDLHEPLESLPSPEPVRQEQLCIRRIAALRGKYKDSLSSSDDYAARKAEETELESRSSGFAGVTGCPTLCRSGQPPC
jgi:hypothetical protein